MQAIKSRCKLLNGQSDNLKSTNPSLSKVTTELEEGARLLIMFENEEAHMKNLVQMLRNIGAAKNAFESDLVFGMGVLKKIINFGEDFTCLVELFEEEEQK